MSSGIYFLKVDIIPDKPVTHQDAPDNHLFGPEINISV